VETESDTVLDISLHTLENLTSDLDGVDNGGKTRGKEDNIGSSLSSLGGTLNSNTTVRLLERGSIVDTVTSHGSQVTTLLQHLDDLVLVLREDFSETISTLNEIVLTGTSETTVDKTFGVVDLSTESKHLASFLGNSDSVTSQHLNGKTEVLGFSDSVGSVVTRGVEHRVHSKQLPGLTLLLDGDAERTETTASEFGSLVTVETGFLLRALGQVEDGLGGTLGASVTDTIAGTDSGNTLGDGVEGGVLLGNPVAGKDLTSLGVTTESENGDLVNGVQVLNVVGRGDGGNSEEPVDIDTLGDVGLTDGELVSSQGTSLVGTENVDTIEGLDSG
jgi:hypothetical protein